MPGERKLELLVDGGVFCEGPRWHEDALWFSDIGGDKVWRLAAAGEKELVTDGVPRPSGLGWTRSGDLLVTSLTDHTIYRVGPDGAARPFCGPERHGTVGTNDMATAGSRSYVSCAGRIYQMGDTMEQIAAPVGKVIMIDHENGAARTVADGYAMPNGIAFSPNGARLVFSELFASRLLEFDVEPDGSLSNERVFAKLDGPADGICMDAEGAVWASVGAAGGARWERIDASGRLVDSVPGIPEWSCIACALGGADGRDLFLIANWTETPDDVFNGRAKSRIYKTRVDVPAAPAL
jgi:sugar lactone lactonase YvrE